MVLKLVQSAKWRYARKISNPESSVFARHIRDSASGHEVHGGRRDTNCDGGVSVNNTALFDGEPTFVYACLSRGI